MKTKPATNYQAINLAILNNQLIEQKKPDQGWVPCSYSEFWRMESEGSLVPPEDYRVYKAPTAFKGVIASTDYKGGAYAVLSFRGEPWYVSRCLALPLETAIINLAIHRGLVFKQQEDAESARDYLNLLMTYGSVPEDFEKSRAGEAGRSFDSLAPPWLGEVALANADFVTYQRLKKKFEKPETS